MKLVHIGKWGVRNLDLGRGLRAPRWVTFMIYGIHFQQSIKDSSGVSSEGRRRWNLSGVHASWSRKSLIAVWTLRKPRVGRCSANCRFLRHGYWYSACWMRSGEENRTSGKGTRGERAFHGRGFTFQLCLMPWYTISYVEYYHRPQN